MKSLIIATTQYGLSRHTVGGTILDEDSVTKYKKQQKLELS